MVGLLGSLAEAIVRGLMLLMGYVSNSSTFPQPLTEEEEARYLSRLQQGDEEARAVLIERNLRLVAHIVKKFDNTGEETDDLISIGTVGLIKAIGTFKPDKGTRLATYAARCIENDFPMTPRRGKEWKSGVPDQALAGVVQCFTARSARGPWPGRLPECRGPASGEVAGLAP